ncbi:MAG: lytic transglycosylase domain-containing protein [Polyangiaceae bacterium]|nr:lytic transglycosylase domain-containing protein [Polyangiaceae bacterium]
MRWSGALRAAPWIVAIACSSTPPVRPTGAPDGSGAPPGLAAPASTAAASAAPTADAGARAPTAADAPWVEAARAQDWDHVARVVGALPAAEREAPGARYVAARAALELGQPEVAARELAGLERQLPELAARVVERRIRAEAEAGKGAAAATLATREDAQSLLVASRAHLLAGDAPAARAAAERGLARLTRARSKRRADRDLEHELRLARAEACESAGDARAAAVELRRVALAAPDRADDAGVVERLQRAAPKAPLSGAERLARATALARAGQVERAESELALAVAAGVKPSVAERAHLLGTARYFARSEPRRAAELLEEAARAGSAEAPRDLLHAARSWQRAHDERRAARAYRQLAARHPHHPLADTARFHQARSRWIRGDFLPAARAYRAYLGRAGKRGRHVAEARYELAVAELAAGRARTAARALRELAAEEQSPAGRAALAQLRAVALEKAGDRAAAIDLYREVVRDAPLTFAALASRARLARLGAQVPPALEPPVTVGPREPLVVELPPEAAALQRLGLDDEAEAALAEQAPELRRAHGERGDEALCAAYSRLAGASRRYRLAQRVVPGPELAREPSPGTAWMWECIYPRPYQPLVRDVERERGLPADLLYAVMRQESAFEPTVVSSARAVGLLQLIPPTASSVAGELGVPFEPESLRRPGYNVRLGGFYLKKVLDTFGGSVPLAAAAYNAGPSAVSRWLETGERLELEVWVARIPYEETRTYVQRVVGNAARYAFLAGGEAALPALELVLPRGLRAGAGAY